MMISPFCGSALTIHMKKKDEEEEQNANGTKYEHSEALFALYRYANVFSVSASRDRLKAFRKFWLLYLSDASERACPHTFIELTSLDLYLLYWIIKAEKRKIIIRKFHYNTIYTNIKWQRWFPTILHTNTHLMEVW